MMIFFLWIILKIANQSFIILNIQMLPSENDLPGSDAQPRKESSGEEGLSGEAGEKSISFSMADSIQIDLDAKTPKNGMRKKSARSIEIPGIPELSSIKKVS